MFDLFKNDLSSSFDQNYFCYYGEMKENYNANVEDIHHFVDNAGEQPEPQASYNIHQEPRYWERLKWLSGVENALDERVRATYDNRIKILENTQATSIIQLKNQMIGFWHTDRELNDYVEFKKNKRDEIMESQSEISRFFLDLIGNILRFYYPPSRALSTVKKLEARSHETYAKIGEFTLDNGSVYDVVAFHPLSDGKRGIPSKDCFNEEESGFCSRSWGETYVGILQRNVPHVIQSCTRINEFLTMQIEGARNFAVVIERASEEGYVGREYHSLCDELKVKNEQRCLKINTGYREGHISSREKHHESDEELDRKLTQIIVEVTAQNIDIIYTHVACNFDCWKQFHLGQFEGSCKSYEEAQKRKDSDFSMTFKMENIDKENVSFNGITNSWSNFTGENPILYPRAAILPEYWEKKPNVVDFEIIPGKVGDHVKGAKY